MDVVVGGGGTQSEVFIARGVHNTNTNQKQYQKHHETPPSYGPEHEGKVSESTFERGRVAGLKGDRVKGIKVLQGTQGYKHRVDGFEGGSVVSSFVTFLKLFTERFLFFLLRFPCSVFF